MKQFWPWLKATLQRHDVLPPDAPEASKPVDSYPAKPPEARLTFTADDENLKRDELLNDRIKNAVLGLQAIPRIVKVAELPEYQAENHEFKDFVDGLIHKDLVQKQGSTPGGFTPTVGDLETMITREWGTDYTYSSLTKDYNQIGDPYVGNIWIRRAVDVIANNLATIGLQFIDISKTETDADGKPFHPPIDDEEHPVIQLFDYINENDSREDFLADIVRALYRVGACHTLLSDDPDDPNIEWDEHHAEELKGNPDKMLGLMKDQALSLVR